MATGAPATELGVWDGSRRGSKSAADDEAAGDLLLKLQEGGAKVVAINRMADPVLRKAWHGSGSWRSAQVRRPQGAQLQEAVATATAAVASCIPSSTTRQVAVVAVVSLSASASRNITCGDSSRT